MKREFVKGLIVDRLTANDPDLRMTDEEHAEHALEILEGMGLLDFSKPSRLVARPLVHIEFLRRTIQNEYNIRNEDTPQGGLDVADMVLDILEKMGIDERIGFEYDNPPCETSRREPQPVRMTIVSGGPNATPPGLF